MIGLANSNSWINLTFRVPNNCGKSFMHFFLSEIEYFMIFYIVLVKSNSIKLVEEKNGNHSRFDFGLQSKSVQ